MTDNFEKKVAVDGPVVNASRSLARPRFPQAKLCRQARWDLASDGRWRFKREVVLRLLRDEPVQLLSRQLGVEILPARAVA